MRYNYLHNESKIYNMATLSPPLIQKNDDIIGNYKLLKTIGRGVSGKVKLGVHIQTGEEVAIKIISRQQINKSPLISKAIERELGILQLIYHPHLVELKQVLQDSNNVYFITEYMGGGELYQYVLDHGRMNEYDAKIFFTQIISGLAWCHNNAICHRDLKLENILLDKTKQVIKIVDFGMATIQPSANLLRTSCGSPHYASPEIIKGNPYYGPATDIWSCGIILYILLCGYHPFDDKRTSHLLFKIKNGRYRPILDDVSNLAKDLITNMLTVDPNKRFNIHDILHHAWLLPQLKPNPWCHQYDHLLPPLVNEATVIEGWIWETLKILWRDLSPDRIFSALTSTQPNIQKLTYLLLLQRKDRLIALSSSQPSNIPNHHKQINETKSYLLMGTINTPSTPSSPPTLCDDNNTITSPSSSISSYQSEDISTINPNTSTSTSIHSSNLLYNGISHFQNDMTIHYTKEKQSHYVIGNVFLKGCKQHQSLQSKKRSWYPFYYNSKLNQIYQHKVSKSYHSKPFISKEFIHHVYDNKHFTSSLSTLLLILNSTCSITLKSNDTSSSSKNIAFSTSSTTTSESSSISSSSLTYLSSKSTTTFSLSSSIPSVFNKSIKFCKKACHHTYTYVKEIIIKKKDTPSNIFSIGCSAKHVNEAAGKLHHVLQENFNGYLHQRGYLSGQMVWTGSIQVPGNDHI
ncbi:unnamed protein product [Cunninghamella blakesleeana]